MTKIENGFFGFLSIKAGAYSQIIPSVFEQAGYDIGQIAFIPYGLIVHLGTYSEFILPLLIVLGLCTRLAAVGMIGFILVQSIVDIFFHHVDVATIGAWFDRDPASTIADQRGLWVLLLFALVCFGAGRFSLDHLIVRWRQRA